MDEVVLYRKYRPREFTEVLGQEHVTEALAGAVARGKIGHAYLFSGSRGTGKTSTARIFARLVGVSSQDLYEMDAASNRGIEDVRALRDAVNTLPFSSPYKLYIIDEAHMLTREAFNALLKTLEEPPRHVIFVLATTEIEKLPETVVSRCEVYTFRRPSQKILADLVLSVAEREGYALERPSAELIALLGDGSFRDTQGILQKVLNGAGEKKNIRWNDVERLARAPRREIIHRIMRAIASDNLADGLTAANDLATEGSDMRVALKILLHTFRLALLIRFGGMSEDRVRGMAPEDDVTFLREITAEKNPRLNSKTLLELLAAADATTRSPIPQLPLELALVNILAGHASESPTGVETARSLPASPVSSPSTISLSS